MLLHCRRPSPTAERQYTLTEGQYLGKYLRREPLPRLVIYVLLIGGEAFLGFCHCLYVQYSMGRYEYINIMLATIVVGCAYQRISPKQLGNLDRPVSPVYYD